MAAHVEVWGWSVFNGQHSFKASPKECSHKCSSTVLSMMQKKELGTIVKVLSPKIGSSVSQPSFMINNLELLDGWDDEYNGIIIDPQSLPSIPNAFASSLRASLSNWKLKGKKGIWLKIPQEQAHLVPIAIQEGFNYHHAEPGYVMLTQWIANEACTLPASPSHQVGIAAFVINYKREILAVKEKCPCSCSGVWKLPTGYIDKSEEIFTGAVREVKEETGVETAFLEMVAFRHAQFVAFEKSDLMFVCMLKPLSFEITVDQKEIQDAKWITIDELVGQPFYAEDPMAKKVIEICMETYEIKKDKIELSSFEWCLQLIKKDKIEVFSFEG
ncbi:hypothetical protein LguiB_018454 [Lonicera macranthoides]